jgi:hypothetical protein
MTDPRLLRQPSSGFGPAIVADDIRLIVGAASAWVRAYDGNGGAAVASALERVDAARLRSCRSSASTRSLSSRLLVFPVGPRR